MSIGVCAHLVRSLSCVFHGSRIYLPSYSRVPGCPTKKPARPLASVAEFQRRGLGRQLVDLLLAHARAKGARSVWLTTPSVNRPGIAFYEALGFAAVEKFLVTDHAPHQLEITKMQLSLLGSAAPPPLCEAPASAVHAYFSGKCGSTDDEQIAAVRALGVSELERLQAEAVDVAAAGRDQEARGAGLQWATLIGNLIA